ncbi:MAG: ABC transporter substrate binding protein [Chloroflexota bacterium]|nr:ABC transporter substrate binding protein [Chloroflexota bacterium]
MFRKTTLVLIALSLLLTPAALAQDAENPTIAILRFGRTALNELTRIGILDVLQAYQFINADERALLNGEEDLEGERVNIIWGDGGMDLPTANIMVENALDRGADILLPLMTPVAQIAANLTFDLEQPPLVLFSIVSAPYAAGIADAPCLKPPHIAGTQAQVPFDQIVSLLRLQQPDIRRVGTMVNAAEPNSVNGVEQITQHAEALGLTVESAPIASLADVPIAAETLLDKGVEAILISSSALEVRGLSAITEVAAEYGVPVYSPAVGNVHRGAHVGAGFDDFYREGVVVGRMLAAHLERTFDVSSLAINALPSLGVALNLDAAAEASFSFSEEMLALADYVIENGESTQDRTPPSLPDMTLEERRAADLDFLAGLECTDEMIAEQQAQLDAAAE